MRDYPWGLDWEWFAVDRDAHVAIFVTAGEGPVPVTILDDDYPTPDDLDPFVQGLPPSSGVEVVVAVPNPTSFTNLASRGMTVFDWSDVHREKLPLNAYEVMCRPHKPINLVDLDPGFAKALSKMTFQEVSFREIGTFDPRQFVETVDAL